MARKTPPPAEQLASEFWVVHSVNAGRYDASVVLSDLYCWMPSEDEDADTLDVPPGTKGCECQEHTEHQITVPVSPQTRLRPGMPVRITVEPV